MYEEQIYLQHDDAYAAAESRQWAREMQDEPTSSIQHPTSPADAYNDLVAFVERVAKRRYEDTHEMLVQDARRLMATEELAEVHLANECPECDGAGYFDIPFDEPERCEACDGTGNAVRRAA